MSKLLDIVNAPWAIEPTKLAQIVNIYSAHVCGEKIDLKAVEAQLGQPLNNEPAPYAVTDGVAVIEVFGVISQRMNLFSRISGGTSSELLGRDIAAALNDPAVHAIVLHIDSPGGAVAGTQQLADQIYAARDSGKRIVALADGNMASAAYWIGAAAQDVYIADMTTVAGSIGVVTQHVDISKANEQAGIKKTDIYAGKYKRIATENAPLSAEGKAHLQAMVDQTYSVFVDAVAQFRGVSTETVLADMADGRVFVGQQAIDAGLVDRVSTLDALIAELNSGKKPARQPVSRPVLPQPGRAATVSEPAGAAASDAAATEANQSTTQGTDMTINKEFLLANHADLVEAFRAEGFSRGEAEGRTAGATAERERIAAVQKQSLPGHEALIATLAFDGKTTGPEAAAMVLAAEKTTGARQLQALAADGSVIAVPATPSATGAHAAAAAADADADLPIEDRCKARWDKDANLRAEFGTYEAFFAYEKANGEGRVKVLGVKK